MTCISLLGLCLLMQTETKPIQEYRNEAVKLLRQPKGRDDVKRAFDLFEKVIQHPAANRDYTFFALWKQAWCQSWLGEYGDAKKRYIDALKKATEDDAFYLHLELGGLEFMTWQYGEAKKQFTKAKACLGRSVILFGKDYPIDSIDKERIELSILDCRLQIEANADDELRKKYLAREKILATKQKDAKTENEHKEWTRLHVGCLAMLSELDRRTHYLARSIKPLQRGLEEVKLLKDANPDLFSQHLKLAIHYTKLGTFEKAREHLQAAEQLLKLLHEPERASFLSVKVFLDIEKLQFDNATAASSEGHGKRIEEAEKLAKEVIEIAKMSRKGLDVAQATNFMNLAQIHELRGDLYAVGNKRESAKEEFEVAKTRMDDALREYEVLEDQTHDWVLHARRIRGRMLRKSSKFNLARQTVQLDLARKEVQDSLAKFSEKYRENKDRQLDLADFYLELAEIEDAAGNPEAAWNHTIQHRRVASEQLTQYLARLTTSQQIDYFRYWDDPKFHASLRLGLRRVSPLSAEAVLNGKAKGAEVMAEINRLALKDPTKNGFDELQQASQSQSFLLYGFPKDPHIKAELNRLESKIQELIEERDISLKTEWYRLADLRDNLAPDQVFIDVVSLAPKEFGEKEYIAWIVTKDKTDIVSLGNKEKLDNLVDLFCNHLDNCFPIIKGRGSPLYDLGASKAEEDLKMVALRPLSERILKPVLKSPLLDGKTRWIVSPDHHLWKIPWAALVLPEGNYAIEKFSFRYVISGRDLIPRNDQKAKPKPGAPWVMADPDLDFLSANAKSPELSAVSSEWKPRKHARLPQLPGAWREAEEVVASFEKVLGLKSEFQDRKTTKASFLGLKQAPQVVYLATHSFSPIPTHPTVDYHVQNPLLSCGVVFAGYHYLPDQKDADLKTKDATLPGLLTGAEVLAVNLHGTELVVLSSCRSGTGKLEYGQSPADLRHAFHLAGTKAVVSSLWIVDDRATQELMVSFVRARADRNNPEALQQAQKDRIRQMKEDSFHTHPVYWAAFTMSEQN